MSTANTNLKRHIRNCHSELWHANAPKHGWKNLDSQVSTQSLASQGIPREEFDVERFHQRIVSFIVADDQVSEFCALIASVSHRFIAQAINVIECREFRDLLLLLRSDLQDSMIPHRTKVRHIILEAWNNAFQLLKRDLSVSLSPPKLISHVNIPRPELSRSNIVHVRYMDQPNSATFPCAHRALDRQGGWNLGTQIQVCAHRLPSPPRSSHRRIARHHPHRSAGQSWGHGKGK